jgi:signal transduction histidine kinase
MSGDEGGRINSHAITMVSSLITHHFFGRYHYSLLESSKQTVRIFLSIPPDAGTIRHITPPWRKGGLQRSPPNIVSRTLYNGGRLRDESEQMMQTQVPGDEVVRLRRLVAEYEKKIDDIADVVAHVRHEINNPLTGILGQAQLLLREDLNEKAHRRVETIEKLTRRLADTVGELRQVQKPARVSPPNAGG